MRSEVRVGDIDVRRLNRNSHFTAFVDVFHDIVSAPRHRREQRRHEFHRVMRFQICGVVSEQGVCGGMRFIEAVPGELRHEIENLFDLLWRVAVLHGAGHKAFALSGHLFGDLLAHRAAQQVGFTERISSKAISDLHDLFSMATISNAVTISSFLVLCRGTSSVSGRGEMTTPAACTPALRTRPSSLRAVSSNCRIWLSLSYACCRAGESLMARSSFMLSWFGTILAIRSTSL